MQLYVMAKSPITKYREANGDMTLEDFGKLLKPAVDKSTVSRWERGELPFKRALQIEKVTGIDRRLLAPKMFKGLDKPSDKAGQGSAA
jgi:hypothetical protein